MSTLLVDNVKNFAGTGDPTLMGTAKAWAYMPYSVQPLASFNIASITKNSVGVYYVTFTNPMPTAAYAVSVSATCYAACGATGVAINKKGTSDIAQTVAGFWFTFGVGQDSLAVVDPRAITFAVFY